MVYGFVMAVVLDIMAMVGPGHQEELELYFLNLKKGKTNGWESKLSRHGNDLMTKA